MRKKNTIPELVGVNEAAKIMGWDRRKLSMYITRGKFLEPIQRLQATPIWFKADVEKYAKQYGENSNLEESAI
jgi:hypothetical protein